MKKADAQSFQTPREFLQHELTRRIQMNPRYSLRAFSKALGMSHTVLSLVLSGKRPLSKQSLQKVGAIFSIDPQTMDRFSKKKSVEAAEQRAEVAARQLSLDTFALVSDWYHYAILSLLETDRTDLDPTWISRRLGITTTEARSAIERLLRLELIAQVDGVWKQVGGPIRIDATLGTAATRKFQKQLLEKAMFSLENDAPELRDVSSITFAFDPGRLAEVAQEIRKFRREFCERQEKLGQPQEVYNLTVQFYPVSIPVHKK
jgi:uncharacterized protein (TIGR02147 family)